VRCAGGDRLGVAKGEDIVALVGSSTPARLAEALGSLEVELSADDVAELERAVPDDAVLGDRYPAAGPSTASAADRVQNALRNDPARPESRYAASTR
jgi:hypothetical protein